MGKHYYCQICGYTLFPNNNICPHCKNYITPKQSLNDAEYYRSKSMEKYGDYTHWHEFLIEEIKDNPRYNPNTTVHNAEKEYERQMKAIFAPKPNPNTPKCPTCGSTDLKKISTTSKVVGATMFGLFSKTARSQFECKNCGYKW